MGLNVTPEEQEKFRELNRLRMKTWRDKKRVRKYSPRKVALNGKDTEVKKDGQ
jgi:hypothetical protein